jgi:Glu-tRNA(Gln) amidotransferase subunit E-like FAD-binding protein
MDEQGKKHELDRSQAVRKAAKARRLAFRAGTREEAMQAAGIAHDLIRKYGITEEEIEEIEQARQKSEKPKVVEFSRPSVPAQAPDLTDLLVRMAEELAGRSVEEFLARLGVRSSPRRVRRRV